MRCGRYHEHRTSHAASDQRLNRCDGRVNDGYRPQILPVRLFLSDLHDKGYAYGGPVEAGVHHEGPYQREAPHVAEVVEDIAVFQGRPEQRRPSWSGVRGRRERLVSALGVYADSRLALQRELEFGRMPHAGSAMDLLPEICCCSPRGCDEQGWSPEPGALSCNVDYCCT